MTDKGFPFLSHRGAFAAVLVLASIGPAYGQLFEADSKNRGGSKMDIVVKESDRRPRASVLDIRIQSVGSSVGASFFLLCSIRQLAKLRGGFRYIAKLEETPGRGQMLVGFLRGPDDAPAGADPAFASSAVAPVVVDLDQFAPICERS